LTVGTVLFDIYLHSDALAAVSWDELENHPWRVNAGQECENILVWRPISDHKI
jgi:hypothetical protein